MNNTPTIFVTGASGQLGRLAIDVLLETMPATALVAGVRDPHSVAADDLRERGVQVRVADYARPETLAAAFVSIDRLLMISGSEVGHRKSQHRNVIAAAKQAGVSLIAYTSILRADTSPLALAEEHRDTEAALAEAGVPFVLLRNGWYSEVYTWRLPAALLTGQLDGCAKDGRISAAARADYARAAATVVLGDDQAGRIYELAGDTSFTLTDLAAAVTDAAGRPIRYRDLPPQRFEEAAVAAGVSKAFAVILADIDVGVAGGALFDDGHSLSELIGAPTTPYQDTIRAFVESTVDSKPVATA